MTTKRTTRAHWLSAAVAVALFVVYLYPVVVKLADVALWVVALIGFTMMLVDLWQSMTEQNASAGGKSDPGEASRTG